MKEQIENPAIRDEGVGAFGIDGVIEPKNTDLDPAPVPGILVHVSGTARTREVSFSTDLADEFLQSFVGLSRRYGKFRSPARRSIDLEESKNPIQNGKVPLGETGKISLIQVFQIRVDGVELRGLRIGLP